MRPVQLLNTGVFVVRLRRWAWCLLLSVLCGCVFSLEAAAQTPTAASDQGISDRRPDTGPAVEYEGRWLVPYEATIPGTDVRFRMIPIPGGEYQMGSADSEAGRGEDEGPVRRVRVAPFWMGECEVTWAEYKLFMQLYRHLKEFEARGVRKVTDDNRIDAVTAPTPLYEPDFTFEYGDEPQQPAVSMTQYSARQYTKWLSAISGQQYRLPTEAEWEYACRGGTTTAWSFGSDVSALGEYAWFAGNSEGSGTKVVRQKKPNPFGLYDMHGNAAEWVIDAHGAYPQKDLVDAAADWVRSVKPDPRVVRGGSWELTAEQSRSAARLGSDDERWKEYDPNLPRSPWWFTTDPARGVGFRLLRPARAISREAIEEFWKIDCDDIRYDVEDRLNEGRGVLGLVDRELPQAILDLQK
jgi:formylglycine-generating enzyme required for sulfatase activity